MIKYKLCFVLLLPLTVCSDTEETLVKTIGSEPDLTPICDNSTLSIITLIVCKIRTERNREECRLLYKHEHGFKHECDPRFTLMTDNQTVFLRLISLTPVDSGNITCQCSHPDGTFILHLNVTVEAGEPDSSSTQISAFIGVTVVIILTAVTLGLIHRRRLGRQPEPVSGLPSQEPNNIEPYSTFMLRDSGLYTTTAVHVYTKS